jgi:hypothetical protein
LLESAVEVVEVVPEGDVAAAAAAAVAATTIFFACLLLSAAASLLRFLTLIVQVNRIQAITSILKQEKRSFFLRGCISLKNWT